MNIGFFTPDCSERGVATSVFNYAYHNRTVLGNKSFVIYKKNHHLTIKEHENKFEQNFCCFAYETYADVDDFIVQHNIVVLYTIKWGMEDNMRSTKCPNIVHAVFSCEPHGDRYAVVSKWLSDKYSNGQCPYVPHMIDLPDTSENLRTKLGIPSDAIVIGTYGGFDSFDIPFVVDCLNDFIDNNPHTYFIYMGVVIDKITDNPRIIRINRTCDRIEKVKFINTVDAMIHARKIGETFGLSVGEFSIKNKPIITYQTDDITYDKEHIRILGDKGLYYTDYESLQKLLIDFRPNPAVDWNAYEEYVPEKVMAIFQKVFLDGLHTYNRGYEIDGYTFHQGMDSDGHNLIVLDKATIATLSKICNSSPDAVAFNTGGEVKKDIMYPLIKNEKFAGVKEGIYIKKI